MIPQRSISLVANTILTASGHRIPEAVIERDYVLAWFLTGLAGHALRSVPCVPPVFFGPALEYVLIVGQGGRTAAGRGKMQFIPR